MEKEQIKANILESFKQWDGQEVSEESFNEWIRGITEDPNGEIIEVDRVINEMRGTEFEYTTWLIDRNSDEFIVQISIALKNGMYVIIDNYAEVPFHDLKSCIEFIEHTNAIVKRVQVSDYEDIGGKKTQIIIDHNKN